MSIFIATSNHEFNEQLTAWAGSWKLVSQFQTDHSGWPTHCREYRMKIREDIHIGRATVKAAEKGGWALPGGRITGNHAEAMWAAVEMDRLIGEDAFVEDNRKMLQAIRKRNINARPPVGL